MYRLGEHLRNGLENTYVMAGRTCTQGVGEHLFNDWENMYVMAGIVRK